MIRLPPTGIDISQNDLQAQLQHLDFYSGLLKQGFKKQEIVRYLRERDADNAQPLSRGSQDHALSTYRLLSSQHEVNDRHRCIASAHQSSEGLETQFASPTRSPDEDTISPNDHPDTASEDLDISSVPIKKTYTPRQSSLLRFARAISSEASDDGKNMNTRFSLSPRAMTYRPRSDTYSYDQSELDEEDFIVQYSTPDKLELELESLSLYDDAVTSAESTRTVQITSSLRPDAEPFTPSRTQFAEVIRTPGNTAKSSTSSSTTSSFPSSPPEISQSLEISRQSSPSLPPVPRTPTARAPRTPSTVQDRSRQQFLDGSFTVYNDSVPARLQPQTPAELNRSQYLSQHDAAFTAPPGMIRSSAARYGISSTRQASGELSPTAQAMVICGRRQREFQRGLHVEGRRIDRSQINTRRSGADPSLEVDPFDIWRDDLDADGVGEENFEEASLESMLRRMRVFSGNRRLV